MVEKYTNIHAVQLGLGGAYSKKRGSNGAIYRQWQEEESDHDVHIDEAMSRHHYLQIKWCVKLNNNETTPKRGEENYDPDHKFDLVWDVLTHNTNAITKYTCLDVVGDETSWGHQGF
eukprot:3189314-Ditylum_brightwellii.AAC.1